MVIISYSECKYRYVHNQVGIHLYIMVYLGRVKCYSDRSRATLLIPNFESHKNDWLECSSKKNSLRTPWTVTLSALLGHLNVTVKSKFLPPLKIAPQSAVFLGPHFKYQVILACNIS